MHLDGLSTAHVAVPLRDRGVLDFLSTRHEVTLDELSRRFKANDGYLNVAMRTLASQGWLDFETDNFSDRVTYTVNERTSVALDLITEYEPVVSFSRRAERYQPNILHEELFAELSSLLDRFAEGWFPALAADDGTRSQKQRVLTHIEGCLLAPILVKLGMDDSLHGKLVGRGIRADDAPDYAPQLQGVLDFLTRVGWAVADHGAYRLTLTGGFFARRASAYGVIVSYLPTFRRLDEMIFGNPTTLKNDAPDLDEEHVDRRANIWGSGGAHANYFRVIDDVVVELFNRPIVEQPKGIVDMGCGNGAFLNHLYQLVKEKTLRGKLLDEYPLVLIGADYNRAALDVARANLAGWCVPAEVISGDIGQPGQLAEDLLDDWGVRLEDMLNVRTFLDHNRIWEVPPSKHYRRPSSSSGAFAHRGARVSNNDLEVNLYHHLKNWSPYLKKFGLLIIELHTIRPELAAAHIGSTTATAYDAVHGFSDQYIVEIDVLHRIAADAGLISDPSVFRRYPGAEIATVSVSLFRGAASRSECAVTEKAALAADF